jgi:hypothetical protein
MTNKPIFSARSGNVSGAVWKSEKDGKVNFSFTVKKQYKSGGEYKKTEFFFLNEAADLMAVCIKLISYDPYASKQEDVPSEESGQEVPF